jgi:kynurenine 3-monooxygenase
MKQSPKKIAVVGAGPVGSLLSLYLSRLGHAVQVFERRPDMRSEKIPAGRSINLACSDRGWKALQGVGLADAVRSSGIAMRGRMIHGVDGSQAFQPYGEQGQAIVALSRGDLNKDLMTYAEEDEQVTFHFSKRCVGVDLDGPSLTFRDVITGAESVETADVVFGADGAFSEIRHAMQFTDRFNLEQTYIEHGYKELYIPADADSGFAIERNALHIWPRGGFMLIALPNSDGSFTCTLFLPHKGSESFESLSTPADVREFFQKYFPDCMTLMPSLEEDFLGNPTASLGYIRCSPWTYGGKVALIGDASHAIVPFYGQGMVSGFEDCYVLDSCLREFGDDWERALTAFGTRRKPDADAISELALYNFVEMRDHVGDPSFLLRKQIEKAIHDWAPERFTPVYTMVTFSQRPYRDALENARWVDALMAEVMSIPDIASKWNTDAGRGEILRVLDGFG